MSIDPQIDSRATSAVAGQKRRRFLVIGGLSLLLLGGFGWYHWHQANSGGAAGAGSANSGGPGGKGGKGMSRGPMPVQAKQAVSGDLRVYLPGLGTVTPLNNTTVHSRVDGELLKVYFTEGQKVEAGDLLAQIDPRAFQVQLTQAEGQLAKDQATLANAKQDLARYQTLIKEDSISQQQVDQQAAAVRQAEGAVKADQGAVDNARLQLSYARITAPVSGKLGLRQVDQGNIVHASDSNGLVTINQVNPIYVVFTIPEDNLPAVLAQVHQGNTLPVEAWDRGQKIKLDSGKLLSMDNQIDSTTGTVKLKAVFENKDDNLFPNQFVNVRMLVQTQANATLLPTAAIQRGAKGTFVFVVNADNTVTARPVTLGPVDGDNVSITDGIKPGENVVFDGADKLKDGGKVNVVVPGAAAPAGQGGAHSGKGQHRHKPAAE